MKKKSIILAILMIVVCSTAIAQSISYTTKRDGNKNFCMTNRFYLNSSKDNVFRFASLSESYMDGNSRLAASVMLGTVGDKKIVSLARTAKSKDRKTTGKMSFANNHSYNLQFSIIDYTNEGQMNTDDVGAVVFVFPFELNSKLNDDLKNSNITTISIDGITLNLKEMGLITGPIFKITHECVFAIATGETVPEYTSKSADAIQLILNPFGVINEEKGLTGSKIVNMLNQHKGWKATIDNKNYITVSDYNISWNGFPLDCYMFAEKKSSYGYTIRTSSESEGRRTINDFCNELAKNGIQMKDDFILEGVDLVAKEGKYANKKILINLDKYFSVSIRVYNN